MKVQIYNWASDYQAGKILATCGYKHGEIVEVEDIFSLAKVFREAGLNVMIPHLDGEVQLITVDYKRLFTQR